eukprot:5009224-Karenia_brevis.AAC.1
MVIEEISACQKHAAEKLNMVVAREYPQPTYHYESIPLYDTKNTIRTPMPMPFNLCHDALARDPVNNEVSDEMAHALGPQYRNHPEVIKLRARGVPWNKIRPLVLYWDGAKFLTTDQFYSFTFQCLLTRKRYLFSHVRT